MSSATENKAGTLYLVPAPLDFGCESQTALTEVLPEGTLRRAAGLTHWISENAKTARAYLKRIDALFPLAAPLQAQNIAELPREAHKKGDHGNKGAAVFDPKPLLAAALAGHDMGLISEAGMPAVADPGSSIVRAAHDLGIRVVPLIGPVSCCWAWRPAASTARTSLLSAMYPRTAASARPASRNWRAWHCAMARPSSS